MEQVAEKSKRGGSLLTGNAAVHHPADHAEQEEQITHEVAVISTSCRGETNMSPLTVFTFLFWPPLTRQGKVP